MTCSFLRGAPSANLLAQPEHATGWWFILLLSFALGACGDDDGGMLTDGGTADASLLDGAVGDAQQPPSGAPDYDRVFPSDRVQRLDIIVTEAAWTSMLDDLQELTGTRPGSGGMMGPGPGLTFSPEEIAACNGQSAGSQCSVGDRSGYCFDFDEAGRRACFLEGGGGGGTGFWPRKPRYVEAEVRFEGMTWRRVGFRAKGNNSLATTLDMNTFKLPFRLKFDEFEDQYPETENQRFFGFQHLSLSNHATDASYLRSFLTTQLYARAGVPAPAMAFYRVYIDRGNGAEYAGLYTVIEIPDDPMMDEAFGSSDGNLYKPDGDGARFAEYVEAHYIKKNNKDAADYSDVRAFVAALNRTGDATMWREGLERTFDMDLFVRYLAVTRAIDNWDTYGGMPHNYYLYNHDGRLRFLPWDFDLAMESVRDNTHFALQDVDGSWPLLSRVRDDETYFAAYRAQLASVRTGAFSQEWITAEIERAYALIARHVVGAEGERDPFALGTTEATLREGRDGLLNHVREQHAALAAYLE